MFTGMEDFNKVAKKALKRNKIKESVREVYRSIDIRV